MQGQVWVVENDADIRDALLEIVAGEGFDVSGIRNAEAATALMKSGVRPCLLLVDLGVPGRQDDPALVGLLEEARANQVAIVAMSTSQAVQPPAGAMLIHKPLQLGQLVAALATHCPQESARPQVDE